MKAIVICTFITLILTNFVVVGYSQKPITMSFNEIPKNNAMVKKSIQLFDWLRAGNLDAVKKSYQSSNMVLSTIEQSIEYFQNGEAADTSYLEFYQGDGSTEMKFRVNCAKIESGLTYWLNTKSTGTNGSVKNFEFRVERDTLHIKIQDMINSFSAPKNNE